MNDRNLSWLDSSWVTDISRDGKVLLFSETGQGAGARPPPIRRKGGSQPADWGAASPCPSRLTRGRAIWAVFSASDLIEPSEIIPRCRCLPEAAEQWSELHQLPGGCLTAGEIVFRRSSRAIVRGCISAAEE